MEKKGTPSARLHLWPSLWAYVHYFYSPHISLKQSWSALQKLSTTQMHDQRMMITTKTMQNEEDEFPFLHLIDATRKR